MYLEIFAILIKVKRELGNLTQTFFALEVLRAGKRITIKNQYTSNQIRLGQFGQGYGAMRSFIRRKVLSLLYKLN